MYNALLTLHVILGTLTFLSALSGIIEKRYSDKIFLGSIVGVSATGLVMIFHGSSTLWVCVRIALLAVVAVLLKVLATRLVSVKN